MMVLLAGADHGVRSHNPFPASHRRSPCLFCTSFVIIVSRSVEFASYFHQEYYGGPWLIALSVGQHVLRVETPMWDGNGKGFIRSRFGRWITFYQLVLP